MEINATFGWPKSNLDEKFESHTIAAIYLALATIFGVVNNSVAFYIIYTDSKLLTPVNGLLLNLATSDILIAGLGSTVSFVNAVNGMWAFGIPACVIYGFLMSFFGITSIFTLAVLAVQRYRIICQPFYGQNTWKGIKLYIFGIWTSSFIVTAPPLVGWGNYEFEAANMSCSINWESRTFNAQSYILTLFSIALIIPVSAIAYSYYCIITTVVKAGKFRELSRYSVVKKKETQVAWMILSMVIAFTVAWGPYAAFSLIISFTDYQLSPFLTIAPSLFAKSSPCYNPIIYFFLNPQFRKSFLCKLKIRGRTAPKQNTCEMKQKVIVIPLKHIGVSQQLTQKCGPGAKKSGGKMKMKISVSISGSSNNLETYGHQSVYLNTCNVSKSDRRCNCLFPYKTIPQTRSKSFKTNSAVFCVDNYVYEGKNTNGNHGVTENYSNIIPDN